MRKLMIFILTSLLIVSYISYQRSRSIHYAYQSSLLLKEEAALKERVKVLKMDIRQMTTPDLLYTYWQEKGQHLNFPGTGVVPESETPIAMMQR